VLFPGIENDPPAGAAPAWSALRVRCILLTSATEECVARKRQTKKRGAESA